MQLDQDWLKQRGEDASLLQFVAAAFQGDVPEKLAVAVSGGGDSMALLHICGQIAGQTGTQLFAVTVDHGLRPESAEEAAFVSKYCETAGVRHATLKWTERGASGNLSANAREARYRLIADWARSQGIDQVMLGHTADDQAENFIMRLARRSGPGGLASMETRFERQDVLWARPLSQVRRAELRDYLRKHDVRWCEDPTNDNYAYERVRVRKALQVLDGLGVSADVLCDVGLSMRMTQAALDHYTDAEARKHVDQDGGDLIMTDDPKDPIPADITRRLWQRMLKWVSNTEYPPRAKSLFETVFDLQSDGQKTIGGCLVSRKGDVWRVTRELQAVRDTVTPTTAVWDKRWQLEGPHDETLEVRALGDGIFGCPDWRETGIPRVSLIATPAVWRGNTLVAAPVAGFSNGWSAKIVADFQTYSDTH